MMKTLLQQLLDPETTDDSRVSVLEDLEFHVSRVINAQDFHSLGGLSAVVPLLNASHEGVRSHAAWVLGTTVKLNQDLQRGALDLGALSVLLQGVTSESSPAVASKFVYALGSVLRFSPDAQAMFVDLPQSRPALESLLGTHGGDPAWDAVALKVVVLLGDLASESVHLAPPNAVEGDQSSGPTFHGVEGQTEPPSTVSVAPLLADPDLCRLYLDRVASLPITSRVGYLEKVSQSASRVAWLCSPLWSPDSDATLLQRVVKELVAASNALAADVGDATALQASLDSLQQMTK